MRWIGLTGGIASGKSTVSRFLRLAGYPVVDADDLAHRVVLPHTTGFKTIVEVFGNEILDSQHMINRKALAKIVFASPNKLRELEGIIHPEVKKMAEKEKKILEEQGIAIAFYEVPLLFEKKLEDQFDQIVLVYTTQENQRKRLKKRDGLTDDEIELRISQQLPISSKISRSDHVISNNGTLEQLENEVEKYLENLKTLATDCK